MAEADDADVGAAVESLNTLMNSPSPLQRIVTITETTPVEVVNLGREMASAMLEERDRLAAVRRALPGVLPEETRAQAEVLRGSQYFEPSYVTTQARRVPSMEGNFFNRSYDEVFAESVDRARVWTAECPFPRRSCGGLCLHLGRLPGPHRQRQPALDIDMIINLRGLSDGNYGRVYRPGRTYWPTAFFPEVSALRAWRKEHAVRGLRVRLQAPRILHVALQNKVDSLSLNISDYWYKGKLQEDVDGQGGEGTDSEEAAR